MGNAGHAIKAIREAQDLSIRELARLAGVSYAYLSKVERGDKEPTARWLRDVTNALGEHLQRRSS